MANEKSDKFTPKELGLTKKEASNLIKLLENKAPENAKKLKKSLGMKDGGLAMAIEKVKAKEMKLGGEAKPLVGGQKKLDKNKDGRISGDDFAMMEMGGKVEEYGGGGKVKGGKMSCRGMGAAIKGGGFSIR